MDTGNSVTYRVKITDMTTNNATASSEIAETTIEEQGKNANNTQDLTIGFSVIIFISIIMII